jgi:predicted TIM-barrel enzyme
LIDGVFRQNLEETGMSYALEVEMIREARAIGLLTCPYVFDPASARQMARAGADVLVAHLGLTTSGSIGATTAPTLEEAARRTRAMYEAARAERADVLVLCHGGPIAEPADAQSVIDAVPGVAGFFGASSIERLATEPAIEAQAGRFRALTLPAGGRTLR